MTGFDVLGKNVMGPNWTGPNLTEPNVTGRIDCYFNLQKTFGLVRKAGW